MNRRNFLGLIGAALGATLLPKKDRAPKRVVYGRLQNRKNLCLSQEAYDDMRRWNVDSVDEQTRRDIFNAC
jgi:hypothetical protein